MKTRILLACTASLLALIACHSKDSPQGAVPPKDAVAATVNGTPISERLVGTMLNQRGHMGRPVSAEARNAFIERLAMQLIITQEAIKKGLDKQPEVADRIELARQSTLVDVFMQDYLDHNPVSEDALKAEYDKIKAQSTDTEYKVRHILVKTEAEAKDIIARLKKNPKAFNALAKEKTMDRGSKGSGGDLGWLDLRGVVPELGAAVTALAKGKFTEQPVKSRFGYHIILQEDSRPQQAQPFEQMKKTLTQDMQQQNLKKLLDELKAKAKVEIAQAPAPVPAPQEAKPAEPAKPAEAAKSAEAAKK